MVLHRQAAQGATRCQAVFLEAASVTTFGLVERGLAEDVVLSKQRPALVSGVALLLVLSLDVLLQVAGVRSRVECAGHWLHDSARLLNG